MKKEEKALAERVSNWLGYLSDERIGHINAVPKAFSNAKKHVTTIDAKNKTVTYSLRYPFFKKDTWKQFDDMAHAAKSLLPFDWQILFTDRWDKALATYGPNPGPESDTTATVDHQLVGYNPNAKVIVTHEGKPVSSLPNGPATPKGA